MWMCTFAALVRRLVELPCRIEPHSICHASSQQVKELGWVAIRVELGTNLIEPFDRHLLFAVPQQLIAFGDAGWVLDYSCPRARGSSASPSRKERNLC